MNGLDEVVIGLVNVGGNGVHNFGVALVDNGGSHDSLLSSLGARSLLVGDWRACELTLFLDKKGKLSKA